MEEYINLGESFNSPLFKFTMDNFMVKRNEFCYAGDWTFKLDLATGNLSDCYLSPYHQNIYKNIKRPIKFRAIGKKCPNPYCVNSSHFMSLGAIPTLKTPTYASLRNRDAADWYTPCMKDFLNCKLYESNKEYSPYKKAMTNVFYYLKVLPFQIKKRISKLFSKTQKEQIKNLINFKK